MPDGDLSTKHLISCTYAKCDPLNPSRTVKNVTKLQVFAIPVTDFPQLFTSAPDLRRPGHHAGFNNPSSALIGRLCRSFVTLPLGGNTLLLASTISTPPAMIVGIR